jgi:DNA-binding NarL/FixJ family response regulator
MTIRVVVVDDQALVRTGLRMILSNAPDMEVVGEADRGAEALEVVAQANPDVVLMDIRMPGMDGVEATRLIRSSVADGPKVIILTTFDLDQYVFAGLRAGASGFLLKDALAEDLLSAVRIVAAGEAVVGPTVTRRLVERLVSTLPAADRAPSDVLDALTAREREVLELIARGLSNADIAGRLFLSEGTVKVHVSRILAKLEIRDRVQAVIMAYETGLVQVGTG